MQKLTVVLLMGVVCLIGVSSALAYNESPMLRTRVAAGELPPVEERLPKEPGRVKDIAPENIDLEIGQYGGTLRVLLGGESWWIQVENPVTHTDLYCWPTEIGDGMLKGYEVNDDYSVFTFYMREGMRWSDGYPFTSEDFRFWYEDVLLNEKLTAVFPTVYKTARKPDASPMELKVIDEYTFQITFDGPFGSFLTRWATYGLQPIRPAHYVKQFHPGYTPMEELEPLIEEAGFEKGEWWRLYQKKISIGTFIPDLPVLSPFVLKRRINQVTEYERNPYYWKVDAAGNQLPYIDRMVTTQTTPEAGLMRILAGEVDLVADSASTDNLAVYKEYEERGGYNVQLMNTHYIPALIFHLNTVDPVWNEVVGDIRFRKAVSYALNRQEIIESVYPGASLPTWMPTDSSYNPDKANQLLDEMGLDKRDADGYRLGPDGKTLVIELLPHPWGSVIPQATLVNAMLPEVGLKTRMTVIALELVNSMINAREIKIRPMEGAHEPRWPFDTEDFLGGTKFMPRVWYAALWSSYYESGGETGEKPSEAYTKMRDLYEELQVTLDKKVLQEKWEEIKRILDEELWMILIADNTPHPLITSKKLGNVPHSGYHLQAQRSAEQMFFRQ